MAHWERKEQPGAQGLPGLPARAIWATGSSAFGQEVR